MKMYSKSLIFFFLFNLFFAVTLINGSHANERKLYIVYMGEIPVNRVSENSISLMDEHHNILSETIGNEDIAREAKIHSYGRSFNGFVANLLPHEAESLSRKENVVSVFPNKARKLKTTRSWDYLGMPLNVKRKKGVESNIIIGHFDTGLDIRSQSFNDKGFGAPPPHWKGKCLTGVNFTGCNNKVIGAQYFDLTGVAPRDQLSPADFDGHGTHTASIAAGNPVPRASLYGIGKGTARGGVPSARIATYKVCWEACSDADVLAAFDAAIADGVDILTVSFGTDSEQPYFDDAIAIGSFHATKNGIFVSCAGGNSGPSFSTVSNVAPWVMTVTASSMDRKLETPVKLGNGRRFSGLSIDTFAMKKKYPLLNGARAANDSTGEVQGDVSGCDPGTLSEEKVKGSIIYCRGHSKQESTIKDLGGIGTIVSDSISVDNDPPLATQTPSTIVTLREGREIDRYINSTKKAKAIIYKTRAIHKVIAPLIPSYSSRGPQHISPYILKPDIAAPGLSILAAYSTLTKLTNELDENRIVKYNFYSGTSMAAPHVAAAAAYVRSFNPKWSPAALKSALMTTAKAFKIKVGGAELAYGSGQLNPRKALHPGLIYDMDVKSYISFFCTKGFNSSNIATITGQEVNCSSFEPAEGIDALNYPSMHIQLDNPRSKKISAVYYRTVTYVGEGKSLFKAKVHSPKGLSITVIPDALIFSRPNQKKSFKVRLEGTFVEDESWYLSGSFVWSDSRHTVRSPILVYRPRP